MGKQGENVNTPLSFARGAGGEAFYEQGNAFRREGRYAEAMNCYMEAIALDPDSPAVAAKQMLEDIMNFYHKDTYNP